MAVWDQVSFVYRSTGVAGLARAAVRKGLSPLLTYERLLVLRAALPQPGRAVPGDVGCEIADRTRASGWLGCGWRDGDETISRYRRSDPASALSLAVARQAERVVGVCLFERNVIGLPGIAIRTRMPSYFVHFIAIHERLRGHGVMGRLLECADRYALEDGAEWRLCLVASHNRASLAGFAKSGAVPVGAVRIMTICGTPVYMLPKWIREGR